MIKHLEKGLIPHLKELNGDIKEDLKNIKGFINQIDQQNEKVKV